MQTETSADAVEDGILFEWLTSGHELDDGRPRHPGLLRRLRGDPSEDEKQTAEDRAFDRFRRFAAVVRGLFSAIADEHGTQHADDCIAECRAVGDIFWQFHASNDVARRRLLLFAEHGADVADSGLPGFPELHAGLSNASTTEDPAVIIFCRALDVFYELWQIVGDERMNRCFATPPQP